jgi:hypothetical protein
MVSLLYGKFQLFHRNFSLMEKLQNEKAMYTRLVYIDTVGHDFDTNNCLFKKNHFQNAMRKLKMFSRRANFRR